jgi:hypothetical protein
VTEFGESNGATVQQFNERIYGLSSDQALESSYFGVPTTRSEGFLEEMRRLLSKSNAKAPDAALLIMDRLSGAVRLDSQDSHRRKGRTAQKVS